MNKDMNEPEEFEPDFPDEDTDFEADGELGDASREPTGRARRMDQIKARGREALSHAAERGRERLYDAADRSRGRLADAIDSAADRLDNRLTHGATYLRTHDVDVIRDDFSNQIRRYPLLSAGVALGAGYLIGKLLSDGGSRRGKRGRSRMGRQLSRAVVSGLGALLTSRVRDNLLRPAASPPIVDD